MYGRICFLHLYTHTHHTNKQAYIHHTATQSLSTFPSSSGISSLSYELCGTHSQTTSYTTKQSAPHLVQLCGIWCCCSSPPDRAARSSCRPEASLCSTAQCPGRPASSSAEPLEVGWASFGKSRVFGLFEEVCVQCDSWRTFPCVGGSLLYM